MGWNHATYMSSINITHPKVLPKHDFSIYLEEETYTDNSNQNNNNASKGAAGRIYEITQTINIYCQIPTKPSVSFWKETDE